MTTIEDLLVTPNDRQVELEQWCYRIGGDRAVSGKWQKGAAGFLTDQFASMFLKGALKLYRQAKQGPARHGAIWQLMQDEKAVAQVSLEALHFILSNSEDGMARNRLAAAIGTRAEFVLFLSLPVWKGSRHIDALRKMNGRNLSMKTLQQRLMKEGFKAAGNYYPLRSAEKLALGTLFLEIANVLTGLLTFEVVTRRNKSLTICKFTQAYWSFMENWRTNLLTHRPAFMPMTVPPKDWTGLADGGFLITPTAVSSVPWERWNHLTRNMHPCVLGSINTLQKVALKKNVDQVELQEQVFDEGHAVGALPSRDRLEKPSKRDYIVKELPLEQFWKDHWAWVADQALNPIRTKFIHSLLSWRKLDDYQSLHFVWHMDYRGRLYQRSSGINYLSSDPFRTQLQFEQAAPMDPNMAEFVQALANSADVKGSVTEKVEWCARNHQQLLQEGENPLDYRAFWEHKKDPWRFVELCLEYACWNDDRDYKTHSIFQLDQKTSAYGIVGCLLRSEYLATLTNVIGEQDRDLYLEVGTRAMELMKWRVIDPPLKHETYCKQWWKKEGISRELVKPCVMPLVYQRSYQSMVEIIDEHVRLRLNNFLTEDGIRTIDLAHTLARFLHQACKEILPGVNSLHRWLVKVAKEQMKQGYRPYWVTPNGLGIESYSTSKEAETITLAVAGRKIRVKTLADDTPAGSSTDQKKSTTQLSADFCHSHDAAFLQRFVWHWGNTYGHPIITIHDCIGVPLDKLTLLRKELPDQFSRYYSEDHLGRMHRQLEKELKVTLPPPPMEHTLKVERIGENPYLFA